MNKDTIGIYVGLCQTLIGHPLDTIKTRIQSGEGQLNSKLWAGISIPLVSSVGINATSFYLFNQFQNVFSKYVDNNLGVNYISGFCSGILSSVIIHPIEYFKIRKQCHKKVSMDLKIIYYGNFCTIARESIGSLIYFGGYFHLLTHFTPFISGGFSGALSWAVTYPIDVVKTRLSMTEGKQNYHRVILRGNLYGGLSICLLRSFIVNGISFSIYDYAAVD